MLKAPRTHHKADSGAAESLPFLRPRAVLELPDHEVDGVHVAVLAVEVDSEVDEADESRGGRPIVAKGLCQLLGC